MLNVKKMIFNILLILYIGNSDAATAIPVDAPKGGRHEAPTFTLLYEVENPQLTLVSILGGEGRIGIKETSRDTRTQTALMTKNLVRKDFANLRVNVVIFDSPIDLYPSSIREEMEHLNRVESVVKFYREKFNVPVWLLGHSNGSISVTEYLVKKQVSMPVSGAVLSASLHSLTLKEDLNVPLLFLHHEDDECRHTPFSYAKRNVETAKRLNKALTQIAVVKGGESHGDPCRDGKHMYYGAYEEAAKHLVNFIEKVTPTQ